MTVKELESICSTLSKPSKMPGYTYGLPASACKIGSELRKVPGSVCSKCYARKSRYSFQSVQKAQKKRLQAIKKCPSEWASAMTELIRRKVYRLPRDQWYFRWHDSGDLQSLEHLHAIVQIAKNHSAIRFWLPTREIDLVAKYTQQGMSLPSNLTIRISAPIIGETSSVTQPSSTIDAGYGYRCPAPQQNGKCGNCRVCWDKNVSNVDYKQH